MGSPAAGGGGPNPRRLEQPTRLRASDDPLPQEEGAKPVPTRGNVPSTGASVDLQGGPPTSSGGGSSIYVAFLRDQVSRQDERKSSFESRGITVITTAGALAALLFGLTALSTKAHAAFTIPGSAAHALQLALVLFTLAAALALMTNLPLVYQEPLTRDVRKLLDEGWDSAPAEAERDVAWAELGVWESAKHINAIKGWCLAGALGLEVLAVVAVAVAVWIVL